MDIRPVDVQMFINKTSQINKQENNDLKNSEQYKLFSENFKKEMAHQEKVTIESNKSEKSQVDKDGKNNNNKNKKHKKKQPNLLKEEKEKKQKSNFFNVSI